MSRTARIERVTSESTVAVEIDLDDDTGLARGSFDARGAVHVFP